MYHATMPTDALLQVRAALFATRDFGFEKVREERFWGGCVAARTFVTCHAHNRCLSYNWLHLPALPVLSRFSCVHSASSAARLTRGAGQTLAAGAGAQGEEDSGKQGHRQRCRAGISGATPPISKPFLSCFGFGFGGFVGATAGRRGGSTTSGAKRGCELHRKP